MAVPVLTVTSLSTHDATHTLVGSECAFDETLDLVLLLLRVLHSLEQELRFLEPLRVGVHLLHDLQCLLLVQLVVTLVIQLVVAERHIAEAVCNERVVPSEQLSLAIRRFQEEVHTALVPALEVLQNPDATEQPRQVGVVVACDELHQVERSQHDPECLLGVAHCEDHVSELLERFECAVVIEPETPLVDDDDLLLDGECVGVVIVG